IKRLTLEQRQILTELWCISAMGHAIPADVKSIRTLVAPDISKKKWRKLWDGDPTGIGLARLFMPNPKDDTLLVSIWLEKQRNGMVRKSEMARKSRLSREESTTTNVR